MYEYGPRGDCPPVRSPGTRESTNRPSGKNKEFPSGAMASCSWATRGMLLSDYGKHVLLPEADFKDYQPPAPFVPDSPGQQAEWLHGLP